MRHVEAVFRQKLPGMLHADIFSAENIVSLSPNIIRKTKNSSFKNEKSKKEVDVTITVSNKDIV